MAKAFNGEMFQRVPINPPGKNVFDLSHENKFTTEFGRLTPVLCEEVLPGDRWNISTSSFIRVMPMVAPIMHEINAYLHFFFVPRRLLWKNWQDFITGIDSGGGIDGEKGSEHMPHYIDGNFINGLAEFSDSYGKKDNREIAEHFFGTSTLWDYLGYPTIDSNPTLFVENSMIGGQSSYMEIDPLLAYQLIWSEYYRDQNLEFAEFDLNYYKDYDGSAPAYNWIDSLNLDYANAEMWNGRNPFYLHYRAWEKDYFTSALPEPQRGPDVAIPLDISAQITYTGDGFTKLDVAGGNEPTYDGDPVLIGIPNLRDAVLFPDNGSALYNSININNADQLGLQVAEINSTINDLRMAIRLQEFYELSARVGNRYKEMIVGHFGVFTPDYRIDRPQYLGGSKFPLQISQVLQTSQTNNTSQPLGDMAGHGISGSANFQFNEEFYEHGYIIGIMSIIPRSAYQQGLPRKFTRFDRLDHYWEKFAHLGEQEVKNKEIYFDFVDENVPNVENNNDGTFGYQSRYSEYKYIPSSVHGSFKTDLNYWHLGRRFSRLPTLGHEFIRVKADSSLYGASAENNTAHNLNRIFAYQGTDFDHFLCQIHFDIKSVRPMPIFGVPRL